MFQLFGGLALLMSGLNMFQVTYVGWIMMNVDTYTIKADMSNGLGNSVVGAAFSLFGLAIMLMASLNSRRVQAVDKYADRERYTTEGG